MMALLKLNEMRSSLKMRVFFMRESFLINAVSEAKQMVTGWLRKCSDGF
jgi:hypothetical protein